MTEGLEEGREEVERWSVSRWEEKEVDRKRRG